MNLKPSLSALLVAAVVAMPAFADGPTPKDPTATPGIDQRLENQDRRIEQGVKSGSLTAAEAARLEKRETRVENQLAAAKVDGKVTQGERRMLHKQLNRDSHAIRHQKHDRRHAPRSPR